MIWEFEGGAGEGKLVFLSLEEFLSCLGQKPGFGGEREAAGDCASVTPSALVTPQDMQLV